MLHLHRAAATCFALMLAGLFVLNTHPALFQLGLAGFTLAAGRQVGAAGGVGETLFGVLFWLLPAPRLRPG